MMLCREVPSCARQCLKLYAALVCRGYPGFKQTRVIATPDISPWALLEDRVQHGMIGLALGHQSLGRSSRLCLP